MTSPAIKKNDSPEVLEAAKNEKSEVPGVLSGLFEQDPKAQEELKKGVEQIQEEVMPQKATMLGELFESAIKRYFPTGGKALDLFKYCTGELKKPETYALEHEFEILTAITAFIPDSLLKFITTPISYAIEPFDKELALAIRENPDVFFNKLREYVQHYSTGKTGVETMTGLVQKTPSVEPTEKPTE
jgi:hypothetical protein